jgi:hypothetical protein
MKEYSVVTEAEVFLLADQSLNDAIDQVGEGQWAMHLPAWFQVGRTDSDPTLRRIVNYHAYDEAWIPDTLAGLTLAEVGSKYDGDLVRTNPAAAYTALRTKATAAVHAMTDPERIVHLTYGDFPAREYLRHITSFRGFRAYDILKLIGKPTKLPDKLVQGMWELLSPDMEDWRKIGVYPAAVAVADNASLQDRLVALSGRQP